MTIEQTNVIDFVTRKPPNTTRLTISDHLSWDDLKGHLFSLQEKLNAYLRFVESGELYEKYPETAGTSIVISLVCKFPPPLSAQWFFDKSADAIKSAGFGFEVRQISD